MLEQKIRVVSESLARTLDRRSFVKKTGAAVVAGLMALAAGHTMNGFALAQSRPKTGGAKPSSPNTPLCTPPGPYCNLDGNGSDPNGCHGARCFQHRYLGVAYACRVFYTYYPAGCWTRASGGGYWTCCDCDCGNGGTCGCAQFSLNPAANPD